VTGLDFSAESLKIARELSTRTAIAATFIHADVLDAAEVLDSSYDMVFTIGGVLMWISDLVGWADNCARLLHPGGVFYLHDIHPVAMALEPCPTDWRLTYSYFGGGHPMVTSADGSYAVTGVGLQHQETHEWIHPVGDVVTALVGAGLVVEFLHEHPGDPQSSTSQSPAAGTRRTPQLPASYSVRAHLPR
jgi:SAM-dependent methyltransferase